MEWMLDSANLNEVRESLEIFPICGVTTNPTILRAEGRIDYAKHLRELRAIVGSNRTFHVQAGVDGCDNIVREAQRIHEILPYGKILHCGRTGFLTQEKHIFYNWSNHQNLPACGGSTRLMR